MIDDYCCCCDCCDCYIAAAALDCNSQISPTPIPGLPRVPILANIILQISLSLAQVPIGDERALMDAVAQQPVVTAIDASAHSFMLYRYFLFELIHKILHSFIHNGKRNRRVGAFTHALQVLATHI
jgi:hypothetical protein